jgi:hypothetical protein
LDRRPEGHPSSVASCDQGQRDASARSRITTHTVVMILVELLDALVVEAEVVEVGGEQPPAAGPSARRNGGPTSRERTPVIEPPPPKRRQRTPAAGPSGGPQPLPPSFERPTR